MCGTRIPSEKLRCLRKDRATRLGRYPSLAAASKTLTLVSGRIASATGDSFSTTETVVCDTPRCSATSRRLTSPCGDGFRCFGADDFLLRVRFFFWGTREVSHFERLRAMYTS